ncbi:MAG: domain S-box [Capsulimonas sp.]|jgi:PAS domain S-box-containing protein|nr:domain S-box [Capsulimonas sp.]
MNSANPIDELRRLEALRRYDILDTAPEERYDNITELAATLCDVPMSLVSLVDENRQWFKSKVGLTIGETHRNLSFCAHAILQEAPMIITDATTDPRFSNNDLVTGEPHIRFYAGFPLTNDEGYSLGTLCAIDTKPRTLTPIQIKAMKVLTQQVMTEMHLRRSLTALTDMFEQVRRGEEAVHAMKAAILDAALDGIVTIDANEIVCEWNPAAEQIFGYSHDEAVGRPLSSLVVLATHEEGRPTGVAELLSSGSDIARSKRVEVIGVGKDGQAFPIELSAVAVSIHGRPQFTVYLRNISDRKQAEAENARLLEKTQGDAKWRWTFLRDVLQGVTNGVLRLVDDPAELPPYPNRLDPITSERLSTLRHEAIDAAESIGFPKDRIYDLSTAVGETAMNTIVHAQDGRSCVSTIDGNIVQVWIEDRGKGIHIDNLPRAMLEKGFTTANSFGHGLKLTLETADRVWLLTNENGTTVVLEKDREEPIPDWLT